MLNNIKPASKYDKVIIQYPIGLLSLLKIGRTILRNVLFKYKLKIPIIIKTSEIPIPKYNAITVN